MIACPRNALDSDASRELVPSAAVELAAAGLRRTAAPLFVEERDAGPRALVADLPHPFRIARAGTRPGLPARDDPVDAFQIQARLEGVERCEQRLGRQEADACGCGPQIVDAAQLRRVLDGYAHPHVVWP